MDKIGIRSVGRLGFGSGVVGSWAPLRLNSDRPARSRRCLNGALKCSSRALALLAFSLALSTSVGAIAQEGQEGESAVLPPLPEKIQDVLEADRLRRRKALAELNHEVREAEGVQLSELENTYQQLTKVKELLELNSEVRVLLRGSPELTPQYERVVGINPGPATCNCLDNAELNWLGQQAQEGQAYVSIAGQMHEVAVGSEVGNSGCRLAEVSVGGGSATLRCGGRSRTFAYQALPASRDSGAASM